MYTVSDVIKDMENGCAANNMAETCFSYRIVYFVNENGMGRKCLAGTDYEGVRKALEGIIRENLTMANCVVIAAVTAVKGGKCVSLLSRSYGFSLDEFLRQLAGKKGKGYIGNSYGRRRADSC